MKHTLFRSRAVPILAALCVATGASAQSPSPPLSLAAAVDRARAHNPEAGSAAAVEQEAAERARQARAGRLPQIDATESWRRGVDPLFAFGSRLAQRRLTADDLALDALVRPDATDDFRASVSVEQPIFDRVTAANVRAASIGRAVAASRRRLVDQGLTSAVTDAFGDVLIAAANGRSATAAVEAARADRELAVNRRDAGRVTDADVLQLDVHLAHTLAQQVQATSDERIARARLNQLMGEPLDASFSLDPTPPALTIGASDPADLEKDAVTNRPDVALAVDQERLAAAAVDAARAAFLPHVSAQGVWELNGRSWSSRSASWVVGAVARINLFHGFADGARLAEARALSLRRSFERRDAEAMARLDVQTALARLDAARASEAVGRAAVDQAREGRRIIRDRYESGLADAATLLRSADAVLQADARHIAARVNVLTAAAHLQRATGRP